MLGELNQEQIRKTAIILGIPDEFIKKDYFVTKAIQALINVDNDYFELIFQGGTSLSKGYQIISRLSEDIDFRVNLKPKSKQLGKESRRKQLRKFRHSLVDALEASGFIIPKASIKVFYEGRFMSIGAEFEDAKAIQYLKPHIAIECFVGEAALAPTVNHISTLIKDLLKDECEHIKFPVKCVAVDETAAEKWVALTRRVANTQLKSRRSDKHLVRHLYDLYHLNTKSLLTGAYLEIAHNIIEKDRIQFQKANLSYAEDPINVSKAAIELLSANNIWRQHWDNFLTQMVYEKNKPSFDDAYQNLLMMSDKIFREVELGVV